MCAILSGILNESEDILFHTDYEPVTWIPYLVVITDFLKGVAWPLAAIWIASRFSSEIKQLIPNIRQVGPTGVHIEKAEQDGVKPEDLEPGDLSNFALDPLDDPVAANIERTTYEVLDTIPQEEQVARLTRALSIQQMNKSFAICYSGIFGSQIRALHELNSRSVTQDQAKFMFHELKEEIPSLAEFNLEQYLQYLFAWSLIEKTEGAYRITKTGQGFLRFLVDSKLSEDRPN